MILDGPAGNLPARPRAAAGGGPRPVPDDPAWTVAEAAAYFTESGVPITERQLAAVIAVLPGFRRAGAVPSGPKGGRGKATYPVRDMMDLVSALARWLA